MIIYDEKKSSFNELTLLYDQFALGKMKTFTIDEITGNQKENPQSHPMEILNTLAHGSSIPDLTRILNEVFKAMLLFNLDSKNGQFSRTEYRKENKKNNFSSFQQLLECAKV